MSKAAQMAKVSTKGSFHLMWGLVISTIISSVGTIFAARLLGSDLYGLYCVVLTVPTLIGTFRDWGVNSAMVRFAAQYRAEGREAEVRSVYAAGLIFELIIGFTLSVVCFALSGFLADTVFQRPQIAPLIELAAFVILAGGLTNAATAAFTGLERMELNNIMLICQSIIKTTLIITLVEFGFSASGAVTGDVIAHTVGGIVGIWLVLSIYRKLPKPYSIRLEIKEYIKIMLKYGAPLSISAIIGGFLTQYYAFLLPIFNTSDNIMIGNYGIAVNFIVLIGFFATPITTMLFPAFSKLDPQKDSATIKNVFQFSIKYASLLVVPVAALMMCIAEPAVSTLFGETYNSAPLFLALLSVTYLYTAFGNLSAGNLLNSQGKTKLNLYLTLITASIGFPVGYFLIMEFGVLGLIVTTLTSGIPSLFLSLYWTKKHYGVSVDWRSSTRILVSSGLAAALTYALISSLGFANWIRLVVGLGFFLVVFVFAALLTRTVVRSDITNLREMISELGPLRGLVNRLINIIERIMGVFQLR
jgi:O-antigen/teichoic acid export membrane protein